jgi:hypothetical protein
MLSEPRTPLGRGAPLQSPTGAEAADTHVLQAMGTPLTEGEQPAFHKLPSQDARFADTEPRRLLPESLACETGVRAPWVQVTSGDTAEAPLHDPAPVPLMLGILWTDAVRPLADCSSPPDGEDAAPPEGSRDKRPGEDQRSISSASA